MSVQQADILTIVEGCIQAHPAAQRALVNRCAPSMMSVARRYARNVSDAEDILQESFVLIFKNIHLFSFKGSIEGWLKRVLINHILQQYRKETFLNVVDENVAEEIIEVDLDDDGVSSGFLIKIISALYSIK